MYTYIYTYIYMYIYVLTIFVDALRSSFIQERGRLKVFMYICMGRRQLVENRSLIEFFIKNDFSLFLYQTMYYLIRKFVRKKNNLILKICSQ